MEFSYTVSEAEYLAAWRHRVGTLRRSSTLKTVIFWLFILICLILLWLVVSHTNHHPQPEEFESPVPAPVPQALWVNLLPFVALGGFWIFLLVGFSPARVRRLYRKDPAMKGRFTVEATVQSFSMKTAAGSSWASSWNFFESWRERKNLIILILYSGTYLILNLGGLSEVERSELRGILTSAMTRK
jgi:hypothetical protein